MREITTHMLMIARKFQIKQFTQITPHKQKPTGKVISTRDMISSYYRNHSLDSTW